MLYRRTGLVVLNPLVLSMLMIIAFLVNFQISFNDYNKGGQFISFFLGPATVILAVPLYKKIHLLKANVLPILAGITIGSVTGIVSIIGMCRIFGLGELVSVSMIPKSITTPIGIELSNQLGGLPSITVAGIVFTGISGVLLGPMICRLFRIDDRIAVGIAIGTSSHALGTTKAVELGETEGAMSGLAIGITGQDGITHLERAVLHQQGGNDAFGFIERGFNDGTNGLAVGVGMNVHAVADEQNSFQQIIQTHFLFGRYRYHQCVAIPFIWHQTGFCQLMFGEIGVGIWAVDLVECNDDGNAGSLGMCNGFAGLRHDAVSGSHDQNYYISTLGTASAHCSKCCMAWSIQEGDQTVFLDHLVSTDVLGNTACFAARYIGVADGIQQGSLAMVNVA